jgi:DNA invertase Pin-like site-specific DNA recombinase
MVDYIIETASAKYGEDEGLQAAFLALKGSKADAVVVVKLDRLDRLSRTVEDLARMVRTCFKKHVLLSVDEQIDTRFSGTRAMLNIDVGYTDGDERMGA